MADFEQQISINAPLATVWESWDRFGEISRFNKGLRASALMPGSLATGVGAQRRCDLKNGKDYLCEEITEYRAQQTMVISVYDTNLPVKSVLLRLTFSAPGSASTKISATVSFTMKFGLLGRMIKPFARKGFQGDISRLLQSNKSFDEAA